MVDFGWEIVTEVEISFRAWSKGDYTDLSVLRHVYGLDAINWLFSNKTSAIEFANVPLFF